MKLDTVLPIITTGKSRVISVTCDITIKKSHDTLLKSVAYLS